MSELAIAIMLVFVRHLAVSDQNGVPKNYKIGQRIPRDQLKEELDPSVYNYAKDNGYFKETKGQASEGTEPEPLSTGQSSTSKSIVDQLGKEDNLDEGTDQTTTSPKVENITPVTGDGSASGYVDGETPVEKDVDPKTDGVTFNGTQEEVKQVDGLDVPAPSIGNPNSAVTETPIEGLEKAPEKTEEIQVPAAPTETSVDSIPEISKTETEKAAPAETPKAAEATKPKPATSKPKDATPKEEKSSPFNNG